MEIAVNCLAGLFELPLWLIFVQPFRIIQYIFRLFRLDAIAKVVGYIAYPACYIIILLESFRDTFGGDILLATVPQALGLRALYHIKGPNEDIMYNSNHLCNGLTAHCYCAKGNYDQAKKLYLKSLCLFSWFLLITQISGKKKKVINYRGTIDQLYNAKKYSELVAFYEGKPNMQDFATTIQIQKYIFSLWFCGNTKRALKLAKENKKGDKDTRFDELFARECESKGDLQKAVQYFRSAKLEAEEKRIHDIIDENERALVFEMETMYNNKEYAKVIEIFEKNNHIANRHNGEEIVSKYLYSMHATTGVSQTLVSAIERYSKNTKKEWEQWQAEYYENQGEFLLAAEHYKLAGLMADYNRMLNMEEERKRLEEEKRVSRETAEAKKLESQGNFIKAAEHYKSAGLMDDYQRMLDKEEERKRIEEEKRIAREKQAAHECEERSEFIDAAKRYEKLGMTQEHDRCIDKATEQAHAKENDGDFAEAAKMFQTLNLTADYERANKKEHDRKIAKLKEKIKNEKNNKAYGDVIENVESCPELLDDEEIINCYLWSLWLHRGTEDKAVEMVRKYAQKFNTDRWESILGHYYAWKSDYQEALKHYRLAGMHDEIKEMEDKIEEERRRKEEEERRRQEEERKRREEEERRRKEKEYALEKYKECLKDAIEGMDEDYCDRALEYAEKAGVADYDTRRVIEKLKNGIICFNNEEYRNAKSYFNDAGITHWDSELNDLIEASSYSSYSSYGSSSGCSECSNACAGSCGRSCSNGCGSGCTSSCGGRCSYGGSGGRRKS